MRFMLSISASRSILRELPIENLTYEGRHWSIGDEVWKRHHRLRRRVRKVEGLAFLKEVQGKEERKTW
jgi:hypothetical protein